MEIFPVSRGLDSAGTKTCKKSIYVKYVSQYSVLNLGVSCFQEVLLKMIRLAHCIFSCFFSRVSLIKA